MCSLFGASYPRDGVLSVFKMRVFGASTVSLVVGGPGKGSSIGCQLLGSNEGPFSIFSVKTKVYLGTVVRHVLQMDSLTSWLSWCSGGMKVNSVQANDTFEVY